MARCSASSRRVRTAPSPSAATATTCLYSRTRRSRLPWPLLAAPPANSSSATASRCRTCRPSSPPWPTHSVAYRQQTSLVPSTCPALRLLGRTGLRGVRRGCANASAVPRRRCYRLACASPRSTRVRRPTSWQRAPPATYTRSGWQCRCVPRTRWAPSLALPSQRQRRRRWTSRPWQPRFRRVAAAASSRHERLSPTTMQPPPSFPVGLCCRAASSCTTQRLAVAPFSTSFLRRNLVVVVPWRTRRSSFTTLTAAWA
mmetsp:Transcript_5744/g.18692  ORF Transcript_5744/g.18692 Transcript_5744/m.18692 type:complete len:257 (+) Transcript_5744:563-1333(+)